MKSRLCLISVIDMALNTSVNMVEISFPLVSLLESKLVLSTIEKFLPRVWWQVLAFLWQGFWFLPLLSCGRKVRGARPCV